MCDPCWWGERRGLRSSPRLVAADGTEVFDTMKEGLPAQEHADPGEVVRRDDQGVTCRRWNWRQGVRTRLNADCGLSWKACQRCQ
jgi:DNA/RNA-binding domain of Phe-tRNA-synthetase-like protein